MKVKSSKICYLCSKEGASTRDHIPPRGIFPTKVSGNLITVWAHEECNNEFHILDEQFRLLLITECSVTLIGKKVWDEQLVRSWFENPGTRKFLLDRLRKAVIKNPDTGELQEVDIILGDKGIIETQMKRFFRGLYYNKFKQCYPSEIELEFHKLTYSKDSIPFIEDLFRSNGFKPKWITVEKGVFRYFFGSAIEHPLACIAIFEFYEYSVFIVLSKTKIII